MLPILNFQLYRQGCSAAPRRHTTAEISKYRPAYVYVRVANRRPVLDNVIQTVLVNEEKAHIQAVFSPHTKSVVIKREVVMIP